MHRILMLLAAVAALAAAPPGRGADGTWIDLTYPFGEDTIYWPTSDKFLLETVFAGTTEAGFYYSAYKLATAEHGGTHLDAPVHFAAGRFANDEIPLERLIGDAVVVDVSAAALAARDYQIPIADLTAWERIHGRIPDRSIVLLKTGYGRFWPDPQQYLGTALRGPDGVAALRFPGLHPDAARWLIEERAVRALGIDTASIDPGQTATYPAHQVLAAAQVPVFENVANLDRLPATGAWVVALPMKIAGGSGGPLRIVARVLTRE